MKKPITKKILKVLRTTAALLLVFLLFKAFLPQHYNAPQVQIRKSTKYWNLSTGSRIGYTKISAKGLKKSTPIIYLHGGPSGPIYDEHIKILGPLSEDGYDVYLYDQVGCGQSNYLEDIEDYTALRHKKDLEEIISQIGAPKVILLGQSWGAVLATLYAADNADKIEKLIFTGPGPILPWKLGMADIPAPDSLHLRKPIVSNRDGFQKVQTIRNRVVDFCAKRFGIKLASEEEANGFYWTLTNETNKAMVCDTGKALKAVPGMGYYSWLMTVNSFDNVEDTRPKLRGSTIPILILKGQCDNQVWGMIPEYLELFKNHELVVVPNAGHGLWIEQPEFYLKTIKQFLAK